jgi:hypothetical protein
MGLFHLPVGFNIFNERELGAAGRAST